MEKTNYTLVVVTPPALKDEKKLLLAVKTELKKAGAGKINLSFWGTREFAYPIKKAKRGRYHFFDFSAGAFKANELNIFLNREKNIYRYLLLRK